MVEKIKISLKRYLQKNFLLYFIIFLIFVSGIVFGSLGVKSLNSPQVTDLVEYIDGFINNLPTASVNTNLEVQHAMMANLKTLFSIWFLGLTVIGIPLTLVIIFTRGFVLGFTIGFLIEQKSIQGILVVLLTIIPQNLLLIPVIFVAAVLSISFSLYVVRGKFASRSLELSKKFLSYSFVYLLLGTFGALAALIQGYASPALIRAVFYLSNFYPQ